MAVTFAGIGTQVLKTAGQAMRREIARDVSTAVRRSGATAARATARRLAQGVATAVETKALPSASRALSSLVKAEAEILAHAAPKTATTLLEEALGSRALGPKPLLGPVPKPVTEFLTPSLASAAESKSGSGLGALLAAPVAGAGPALGALGAAHGTSSNSSSSSRGTNRGKGISGGSRGAGNAARGMSSGRALPVAVTPPGAPIVRSAPFTLPSDGHLPTPAAYRATPYKPVNTPSLPSQQSVSRGLTYLSPSPAGRGSDFFDGYLYGHMFTHSHHHHDYGHPSVVTTPVLSPASTSSQAPIPTKPPAEEDEDKKAQAADGKGKKGKKTKAPNALGIAQPQRVMAQVQGKAAPVALSVTA